MQLFTVVGLLASFTGCSCLYLSSTNQSWLASAWPRLPARAGGALLVALAWLALAQEAQAATATFMLLAILMLAFTLMPYLGAFRHARRKP
ncbi:hypothetical protein ACQYYA_13230 [Pseudomonas aeruginosa]|uniref:hypothetical protein n=1 Tax=Pseudomonas aeruginosa TaxID=287 RepID=UPI003CF151C9